MGRALSGQVAWVAAWSHISQGPFSLCSLQALLGVNSPECVAISTSCHSFMHDSGKEETPEHPQLSDNSCSVVLSPPSPTSIHQ